MVTALEDNPEHGACGALLVYPMRPGKRSLDADLDLTVQHRGIAFGWEDQAPRPVNLGKGDDPTSPQLTGLAEQPAATAACLLVRRSSLEEVDGLAEEYLYGWEDVDLCLSLRDIGLTTVVSGDAALFHHEFGTQDTLGDEVRRLNYLWNRRQFAQRWSPRLSRTLRLDRLRGGGFWTTSTSPWAAITLTNEDPKSGFGDWYTAHELGNALGLIEWSVDYAPRLRDRWYQLGDDLALFIALLPQFDLGRAPQGAVRIAWIRSWVDRWIDNESFERYDLAVCATSAFAERVETRSSVPTLVLPLATNLERFARTPVDPDLVADYAFAGNHWNVERPLLSKIEVRPGEDFRIYGSGWDEVAEARQFARGPLPYSRLPHLYSSTPVILDDTAPPNVPALNSRVFDALATGALVITDNPAGSAEFFDGRLPAATTSAELRAVLDRYLDDDDARTEMVTELRNASSPITPTGAVLTSSSPPPMTLQHAPRWHCGSARPTGSSPTNGAIPTSPAPSPAHSTETGSQPTSRSYPNGMTRLARMPMSSSTCAGSPRIPPNRPTSTCCGSSAIRTRCRPSSANASTWCWSHRSHSPGCCVTRWMCQSKCCSRPPTRHGSPHLPALIWRLTSSSWAIRGGNAGRRSHGRSSEDSR